MTLDNKGADHGMFGTHGTGDTSGYGGLVHIAAGAGSSQRPFGGYFDQVADDLERAYISLPVQAHPSVHLVVTLIR